MAVFEDELGDFVLVGELLQNVHGGGGGFAFAAPRRRLQAEMGKENLAELLGRVDVEALAGELEDALAYPG